MDSMPLLMFQYADPNGNVYLLEGEDMVRLRYHAAAPKGAATATAQAWECTLTPQEYMGLHSAFSLAIDNKLCQCELRNGQNGMIIATQDGQQRRYILSQNCKERADLEGLLCACLRRA